MKVIQLVQKPLTVVWAMLVLTLAGCKVGQPYQRPTMALPEQFRSAPTTTDSGTVARIPWRDFFRTPELQNLIGTALTSNFDLQLALKRIEASQAYLRQTRYALLPAVNAQIAASTVTPSKNSLNGLSLENFLGTRHLEDYSANLGLSWEADIWGKIRLQNEATRAAYLQTNEAAKAVRTQLVSRVANGYFNLLLLDAQLDIARRNVALSDSIVRMIRLQKDAGEVTELAVEQAQAQQQAAALLRSQLEQTVTLEENGLRQLLGDMPGEVPRSVRLETFPVADSVLAGVPAQVLANRPDVRASELNLVAANARVGVAQASLYPSLVITATGGLNSFQASNWFMFPASLFYSVAGGLTQPVFQRRQLKTQLEVAHIQRDEAAIAFRQTVTNGVREVADALVQTEKLKEQEQVAAARVVTLKQAIANARLLFTSGLATYLEVITAQSNVLQAELTLAQIKQQRLSAMVDVYRAVGGGWQ
ncbi:efflux transporter outer membrane subunit [Larkinella sp. VNQ87]|uniref:efflux transporter outer membrane subunit n=1 Tax=Larkinella sp. VNQ87 TaxID=3400921 RepID=UPI003C07B492